MRYPYFEMGTRRRTVVQKAVEDHAALRGWTVHALNVRTNHVHVVLDVGGTKSPEDVLSQLKSWATRRLYEDQPDLKGRVLWTEHGSTRWINSADGLLSAIYYVDHCQ